MAAGPGGDEVTGSVVGAALVPGMPHVLARDPAPAWADLREGMQQVGEHLRSAGAETIVLMSTQWFTVLGHQFQLDPNPRGRRVDENWYDYDYGQLEYDLRTDTDLVEDWARRVSSRGLQARRTNYDNFPIDTGTVSATRVLDPGRVFRTALVSCNLYAEVEDLATLGREAVAAAVARGRRIGVVVVSGLSAGLIQEWIDPVDDRVAEAGHEKWNRRVLDGLIAGRRDELLAERETFAKEGAADSQFRALAFLDGAGVLADDAQCLSYGPIWGTGAAVVYWDTRTARTEEE